MSTNIPNWLVQYYGDDFSTLNPSVVFEGNVKAVVRLVGSVAKGHHGLAFVLIKKNGRHNVSDWKSLFEGTPDSATMTAMQAILLAEDN